MDADREPARRLLGWVFLLVSTAVIVAELAGWWRYTVWIKPVPVWAVAARLALAPGRGPRRAVVLALLLGSGGDLALALNGPAGVGPLFLVGMGLFFAGHVGYLAAFAPGLKAPLARVPLASLLALLALALIAVLLPRLGPLAGPVAAYALALGAMAVVATLRPSPSGMLAAGGALFLGSDAVIALNRFLAPVPQAGAIIFVTYYAAQALLAEGWSRETATPA